MLTPIPAYFHFPSISDSLKGTGHPSSTHSLPRFLPPPLSLLHFSSWQINKNKNKSLALLGKKSGKCVVTWPSPDSKQTKKVHVIFQRELRYKTWDNCESLIKHFFLKYKATKWHFWEPDRHWKTEWKQKTKSKKEKKNLNGMARFQEVKNVYFLEY